VDDSGVGVFGDRGLLDLWPGRVAFGSCVVDQGLDFSLTKPGDGAPHLVGRAHSV